MADERSVFPGDDPTHPGRWLDRDAAERLLRGEPLDADADADAVDADVRAQADRLAAALHELGASGAGSAPADTAGERGSALPGEEAALAAFRSARSARSEEKDPARPSRTRPSASFPSPSASSSLGATLDAGLVRLGRYTPDRRARSPWGRPVRYGLAAALAAGMIGGVAVAATAGVLAFGGGGPEPGASATADATQDRPPRTQSPDANRRGDDPRPDGSAGAPTGGNSVPDGEASGGTGKGTDSGSDGAGHENRQGRRWAGIASACRDIRDGKDLDAGRRHTLEDAARGAEQVQKYCRGVLNTWDRRGSDKGWKGWTNPGSGHGGSNSNQGQGQGNGGKGDDHGGDGDGGNGGGHGGGNGGGGGGGGHDGDGHGPRGTRTFRGDEGAAAPTPRISALAEPTNHL
ncbi:hypothetical protein ACH4Y0_16890 [Streptomyces sp. NPDC020707]|uniref:hypothetical protein n=1 Tax=Streptomyces sp. NPDC020707 TaxID=3365084 RepID=UPI0037A10ED8